jgi:glycosyltransferase involved in cell wall biosynthesis
MQNSGSALPISGVIITRDAEATIADCLRSLAALAEVVVYDNGSVDRTREVAASFPNVRLHTGPFSGFGPTKNHAASLASHSWVLSVDGDEILSPELAQSLQGIDLADSSVVYAVWRHNYLLGRRVRHSGWGQDWLPRLYHRDTARLSDAMVHENLSFGSGVTVRRLKGPLRHDAVRQLGDMLTKVNRYSEIRRKTQSPPLLLGFILLRSWWAFWRTYLLQGGWLDGWRGMAIAWSNANGVFYKYLKPYADQAWRRENATGPDPTGSDPSPGPGESLEQ